MAPDRVISVVDPEARHMHKSRRYRDGYKAHIVVEPDSGWYRPGSRRQRSRRPHRRRADGLGATGAPGAGRSAYGSGETRANSEAEHRLAIKPWPMADAGRFGRDDFVVDETLARPPARPITRSRSPPPATPVRAPLQRLSLRDRCTTCGDGRTLRLTSTTPCWSRPDEPGVTETSPRTIEVAPHGRADPRLAGGGQPSPG